jgi:hypothetical protein
MSRIVHGKGFTMRVPSSRSTLRRTLSPVLLFAVVLALAGGSTFALIRAVGPSPQRIISGQGLMGFGPEITLARPLGLNGSQMSLASASGALGASLTLPDSAAVAASDAGPVWAAESRATGKAREVAVAVTFPKEGLIVQYQRPVMADPLATFQNVVKDSPGSSVVYLNGNVPALSIPELPDGSNWGSVQFVSGGTVIVIMGHNDEATLEGVANSILGRSAGS